MNDQQGGPGGDEWRGMTPQDRGLTTPIIDDIFAALSDWRRRAVCRYLARTDQSGVEVRTLAEAVADIGQAGSLPEGKTDVDAIETALVHTHLPALDDIGILDFDPRSNAVHYWGHATAEKWAEHADAVTKANEF